MRKKSAANFKRRTIRTSRLELRPYRESDYDSWATCLSGLKKPRNRYDRKIPPGWTPTRKEFLRILRRQNREAREGLHFDWPIFERANGELIGIVDVSVLYRGNLQVANLGYFIDSRKWGKGFGTEALKALIPIALRDLELNRLEAVIDHGNHRSIALAKKVGMRREGLRRNYYYQDRGWADQVVYVADRADFRVHVLHPKKN